jgi:hypothetical protein
MRRIATMTLFAGILITALSLTTAPAEAETGFWRAIGLSGVDAFGIYNTGPAKVSLNFDLKDTKKDKYSAAVRFIFTQKGHKTAVRLAALHGDRVQNTWQTVTSANTGHMYVQECLGTWRKTAFQIEKCGGWRQRY